MRVAVYAGSFDPPTRGHLDLIERGRRLADRLVVAIGVHPTRKPLFSADERVALLRRLVSAWPGVEVQTYQGLLVDHCRAIGAALIVRGVRSAIDFDYELPIAQANATMAPAVETVLLTTRPEHSFVSASLAREIASHGGDLGRFVTDEVAEALRLKFVKATPGA